MWLLSLVLITLLAGPSTAGFCPVGDLNGNCKVDWQDVLCFAQQWLEPAGCSGADCADLIGDDGVDMADFALLAENWLKVGLSCPIGDLDGSCKVDWQDVLCFCEQWLDPAGCSGIDCADFIGDDGVDMADFALLAKNWLKAGDYLVINEFMASNSSRPPLAIGELVDGNGESSDWIEIYNPTDKTINLSGWYITDNENDLTQWQFPNGVIIPDGNYLVVFASAKTYEDYYPGNYPYLDPNGYYHTNFKLDVDGEYLALVWPDGNTVIDSISFSPQSSDISYGRWPDARDNWLSMAVPTPGSQNNWGYLGIVADTKFSRNRGFYDLPFDVVITCATEGAVIHYTTDGTEPTEGSPQYTAPIHISQTTCLRAKAFKPDYKPSNVDTHTYFFGVSAVHRSLPVISIVGDSEESLYEPNGVMAIVGGHYEFIVWWPESWVSDGPGTWNNPIQRGIAYERPASVELIYPDDNSGFQINCGIRVQGSDWHRQRYRRDNNVNNSEDWLGGPYNMEKFSFMLFFRSRYGSNRLEYPLFPLFDIDRFQSVALRGGFNDCYNPFLNDELYRRLHKDMGYVAAGGMMANVFINGHYKAYYNPCERVDTEFLQEWYNSDKEWDVITQYEPDKSVNGEVRDGDMVAWNALHDYAVSHDLTNDTHYQYVAKKFDITAFIDYLILELYAANADWPRNNWTVAAERSDAGIFRFYMWDTEMCMQSSRLNRTAFEADWQSTGGLNNQDTPIPRLWRALKPNGDFRQLFADRVHKHFNNDGALVETNLANRFFELHTELLQVIPSPDTYALSTWIPQRRAIILAAFASELGFSSLDAPVFNINASYQHGGYISDGDTVTMDNPNGTGTIYYTVDGSDPREGGGGISGSAIEYDGMPFALNRSTHLKARVWDGGQCSALNEAVFAVEGVAENLRITEIMYHPQDAPAGNPDAEFIELKNIGPGTINLSLVRFTEGIHYTFSPVELASGEYVVVVKDQNAFAAQYDTTGMNIAAGQYAGSLANNGERIRLEDAVGQTILDFDYEDGWCDITDGQGYSLTINDATNSDPNSWGWKKSYSASTFLGGSPGQYDYGPRYGDIVINEVLAHSDPTPGDWIELHNTTDSAIDITGWFLSDNDSNLMKYQIPAATIPAHGYIVFTEDDDFGDEFALSENGETVYLSSGRDTDGNLTGYRQQEDFGASENGVAFGRYRKSTGTYNFVAASENTPGPTYEGAANAYPKVGRIVINEIMYHPDWFGTSAYNNDEFEYIELYNISGSAVTLYDSNESEPWKFTDGIYFTFPASPNEVTIDPGQCIVVVRNPAAFAERFPAVPAEKILGPYEGLLANDGEKLEISKPGGQEGDTRYYIRIDRVNYSDGSHHDNFDGMDPWPTEPDGDGNSLNRIFAQYYGNDPNNWQAAPPSPGAP